MNRLTYLDSLVYKTGRHFTDPVRIKSSLTPRLCFSCSPGIDLLKNTHPAVSVISLKSCRAFHHTYVHRALGGLVPPACLTHLLVSPLPAHQTDPRHTDLFIPCSFSPQGLHTSCFFCLECYSFCPVPFWELSLSKHPLREAFPDHQI